MKEAIKWLKDMAEIIIESLFNDEYFMPPILIFTTLAMIINGIFNLFK